MNDALLLRALVALVVMGGVAAFARMRAHRREAPFEPALARLPLEMVRAPEAPLVAYVFTSRLCGSCRETPALVAAAAPEVPLVALPVEEYGALARLLGVDETPTLMLVDAEGRIRFAARGNPTEAELRAYVWEAELS